MTSARKCRCRKGAPLKRVFSIAPGNDVVECPDCGIQYAQLVPEPGEADESIYGYEYFRPELEQKVERRRLVFSALLAEVESFTGGPGRLLDVGAGDGALVRVALERGWSPEATDISSVMARHVGENLGIPAHHGPLEELSLESDRYDAVVLNHVLEHVSDPFTTLETVARLVRERGVVRVEVPNLGSLSSRWKSFQSRYRLKRNPWKHYATGHHYWYFTPRTLVHTMETSGLSVLSTRAPAQQWGEMSPWIRLVNPIFDRWRWGGHLVAYGRRAVRPRGAGQNSV